jgi:hypothetical protein
MAAENRTPTNNPKTQTIRKMLDHIGPKITFLWAPSHLGIPGNEKANQAAKEALDEDISTTERYLPDELKKWLTEEDFKKRDQRWNNGNNEMKERKLDWTEIRIRKKCQGKSNWQYQDSEPGIRGPHTAPRCKGSAIHYALLQHLSIRRPHTVGIQKKLRTRE